MSGQASISWGGDSNSATCSDSLLPVASVASAFTDYSNVWLEENGMDTLIVVPQYCIQNKAD